MKITSAYESAASDYRKKKVKPLALGDTAAYEIRGTPRPGPRTQAPAAAVQPTALGPARADTAAEYKVPAPVQAASPTAPPVMDLRRQEANARARQEMITRQIIREKQSPTAAADPRVQSAWMANDEKFAASRAASLSAPTKLGTAAGGRATDYAALNELIRQRDAAAQDGVPSVTNQPAFDKANQYREPGLRTNAYADAMRANQTGRDAAYSEKDAKLADLNRRISEYQTRVSQPLGPDPVPSEAARSAQLVARDAYATEAAKAKERSASSEQFSQQITQAQREKALREYQPQLGERVARVQEQQALRDMEFDGRVQGFNKALLERGTTPEGLANLGATALDKITSAMSDLRSGVVSGAFGTGSTAETLRQANVFRDQVVRPLTEAAQSNPQLAASTARVLKNKLDDMLGGSEEFKAGGGLTDFVNFVFGPPFSGAISESNAQERTKLAEMMNETYRQLSALSGQ